MLYGQLEVKAKAGGKAQRGLPVTSSSRVSDCDGRPPGAAAIRMQKRLPSSLFEKRYACPPRILKINRLYFTITLPCL